MAASSDYTLNVPFNLTSKLVPIFLLPSRFLARIRLFDELFNQDIGRNNAISTANDWGATSILAPPSSSPPPSALTPFPGPWGFLTSGYALVLFTMAVLLHRIQNIVVPPQRPFAYHMARHNRQQYSLPRLIYYAILPLDFSSTPSRLLFYLPSLYFLSKVLLLWSIILLQTSSLFPPLNWNWVKQASDWASAMPMDDVCWRTFVAVCVASCVETLVRGLEGAGTNGNLSPFNLHGYAFLLHIYASPITHVNKPEGRPSRPDKHIVVIMTIPLLQLAMLHILGVRKKWSCQRLVPTGIATLLSLVHFYSVLWFSPSSYPLLNYMTCIFESFLASVTLLTISLNALTQLLLEGVISRPLFGYATTLLPKWDEDFSMVLIRVGIASLEATSLAGLGNEVGGVAVSDQLCPSKPHTEFGTIEMNRFGVMTLSHTVEGRGRHKKVKHGLSNEIKSIKTGTGESQLWWDMAWYKALARFVIAMCKCGRGLCLLVWRTVRGRSARCPSTTCVAPVQHAEDAVESEGGSGEADVYARFLRGENVSDDEDDDFEPHTPQTGSVSRRSSRSEFASGESEDDSAGDADKETVGLYTDLTSGASTSTSTSAPLLLAHMTDTSSSPLTRRRYEKLVAGSDRIREGRASPDELAEILRSRRPESDALGAKDKDGIEETRRNCVICTVESRQIICWPCRCLALCDECRENLAVQSSASKHRCPCCRRSVEGYSRIFIP